MKRIGKAAALGPLDDNMEPDEEVGFDISGCRLFCQLLAGLAASFALCANHTPLCALQQ